VGLEIEFKAIKPKRWSLGLVTKAQLEALELLAMEVKAHYQRTTETWNHKPVFTVHVRRTFWHGSAMATIGTNDKIFGYVDKGVGQRIIVPKAARSRRNPNRPSALKFQKFYKAKTQVGVIGSRAGGHHGPTVYRAGVVQLAPAIKPRGFTRVLRKWAQLQLPTRMALATKRGISQGIR